MGFENLQPIPSLRCFLFDQILQTGSSSHEFRSCKIDHVIQSLNFFSLAEFTDP